MNGMTPGGRLATLGAAAVAIVSVAGCSTGSSGPGQDKAGGSGEPVVLQMANAYGDPGELAPPVQYFIKRVEQLSGGQIRIKRLDQYGNFANGTERKVVHDTASGKVDLGWVGTRVFDTMGLTSMQALTAPMLIDSYALEDAVISSGLTAKMLPSLDDLGVVGLGILADGLRKPMGVHRPIVDVQDWRGIGFSTFPSQEQADAIRALGATPHQLFVKSRDVAAADGTIQGFEMGMLVARGKSLYGTVNVNLWPQMDVLIANPESLRSLSEQQRGWLHDAARDAANRSADLSDTDAQSLREECQSGSRFTTASPADLVALRQRFDPVYAQLQKNPDTKAFIAQIQDVKTSTPSDPALVIPPSCTGRPPSKAASVSGTTPAYLSGVYRYTITKKDAAAAGSPDDPDYPATLTVWLGHGNWRVTGGDHGTYWVNSDRITFKTPAYGTVETFTFRRAVDGGLTLKPVLPMEHGDAVQWSAVPWTKIG